MDIESLKLLVSVAESGSLAKAAALSNMHQSRISRQLNALERDWGDRLFHRTGRGMQLSEFGGRMLPRVNALLLENERLNEEIRLASGRPSGEVKIGLHSSMVTPLMARLVGKVRAVSEGLKMRVREGSVLELQKALAAGELDIALLHCYRADPAGPVEVVSRSSLHLVMRADDLLAARVDISFSEIAGLPLALPSFDCELRNHFERVARQLGVELCPVVETASLSVMKEAVMHGGMYMIFSPHLVQREIDLGVLRAIPVRNPEIVVSTILQTTTHHPVARSTRDVGRMIRELFEPVAAKCISDQ